MNRTRVTSAVTRTVRRARAMLALLRTAGRALPADAAGFTLTEAVVALGVLALLVSGLVGGLSTLSRVVYYAEIRSSALAVAHHQLEQVAKTPYSDQPDAYLTAIPAAVTYDGRTYTAPVSATPGAAAGSQHIVVQVSYLGEQLLTLEDLKVDRTTPLLTPTPTAVP